MEITADLFDIICIVFTVVVVLVTMLLGFVRCFISIATLGAAVLLALMFTKPLADQLPVAIQSDIGQLAIAFALILFGALLFGAMLNYLAHRLIKALRLGVLDHFLGALFGLLVSFAIGSMLIMLLAVSPLPNEAWWQNSRLIPLYEKGAEKVQEYIPPQFTDLIDKYLKPNTASK